MKRQVGRVEELWRYPVKSMGGERLPHVWLEEYGVAGDRLFALESAAAPRGKPLVSSSERTLMLRCRARTLLAEGVAASQARDVEVLLPGGSWTHLDDGALLSEFKAILATEHAMWIKRSARPQTDCRPIALLSTQTLAQFEQELGSPAAGPRFRANILLDLRKSDTDLAGFGEDALAGRALRIGAEAEMLVKERAPRCRIITVDPQSGECNPALMRLLAARHEGKAGIYAATTRSGCIREGDPVFVCE